MWRHALRRTAPLKGSFAALDQAVDAQCQQRADHAGQQVHADRDQPELGRQPQGDQRGERGTDQPGEVGRQRGPRVAEARREIGRHRAGGLPVRQAQQHEAHQDEDVVAHRAAAEQPRRDEAEHADQAGHGAQGVAAAHPVGQPAGDGDGNRRAEGACDLHAQHVGDRLLGIHRDPRQREHRDHVEQREAGQRGEGAQEHVAAFAAHELQHAHGCQFTLLQHLGIGLADDQAQAGEERHHVDREGDEEREAPAPVEELLHRQVAVEIGEQAGCERETDRRAQLPDHGVPAAPLLRGGHGQQGRQPVPGAAQRQALAQAQHDQGDDGGVAHAVVARQEGHARGGGAQQEQGDRELGAASPAPLHRHRDGRADRARDEGQREDREGHQRAVQARHEGKDERREHQHAGDPEDEEVEILGRTPDDHADRDLTGRGFFMGVRMGQGFLVVEIPGGVRGSSKPTHMNAPRFMLNTASVLHPCRGPYKATFP